MKLDTILIIVGSLITILSISPYLRDVLKRQTKPRLVSWFNWTLLSGIAGAAALSDHQYAAATLSIATAFETGLVFVLGYRYGDRKFDKTDISCQLAAVCGLVLWFLFDSPSIAVIASVSIDFIAGIPTLKHAWQKPYEETLSTFVICFVGATMVLITIKTLSATALSYPIYITTINFVTAAIIYAGRRRIAPIRVL